MSPREKESNSPVRVLRKATGLNQLQFAMALGSAVSVDLIRNLENPDRPNSVTRDLAVRMMIAFGVLPDSLMQEEGSPLSLGNEVYEKHHYRNWKLLGDTWQNTDPDSLLKTIEESLISRLRITFKHLYPQDRFATFCFLAKAFYDCRDKEGMMIAGLTQPIEKFINHTSDNILVSEGEINSKNQK